MKLLVLALRLILKLIERERESVINLGVAVFMRPFVSVIPATVHPSLHSFPRHSSPVHFNRVPSIQHLVRSDDRCFHLLICLLMRSAIRTTSHTPALSSALGRGLGLNGPPLAFCSMIGSSSTMIAGPAGTTWDFFLCCLASARGLARSSRSRVRSAQWHATSCRAMPCRPKSRHVRVRVHMGPLPTWHGTALHCVTRHGIISSTLQCNTA